MVDVFGTIGPSCDDEKVLYDMFCEGMTGIRINLSHVKLRECHDSIGRIKNAADKCGILPKILIDMQGPEIRIGDLSEPLNLLDGDEISLGEGGIFVDAVVIRHLDRGQEILLDDGRILAEVVFADERRAALKVVRGGILRGKKSLAIVGEDIKEMPALTEDDLENIALAHEYSVTGVMQPFVRSSEDLKYLRSVLNGHSGQDIKIYAKVENRAGVDNLVSFFPYADEIVVARGDLGNSMPLWELPAVQKSISGICSKHQKPFMIVTQMLASMEHSKVPTRAEVNDIYNAVLDGAGSVMVTGETAVGDNPVDVIRYLRKTAEAACIS